MTDLQQTHSRISYILSVRERCLRIATLVPCRMKERSLGLRVRVTGRSGACKDSQEPQGKHKDCGVWRKRIKHRQQVHERGHLWYRDDCCQHRCQAPVDSSSEQKDPAWPEGNERSRCRCNSQAVPMSNLSRKAVIAFVSRNTDRQQEAACCCN